MIPQTKWPLRHNGAARHPVDIRDKLNEIEGLMPGSVYASKWRKEEKSRLAGAFEVDRLVDGSIIKNTAGKHFLALSTYSLDSVHGSHQLSDALHVSPASLAIIGNDAELATIDTATTAFVDTETTGLSGGTGTHAFMVGVGRFTDNDMFEVRQYFMRDFDEEAAMLTSLAGWLDGVSALVTYNGKSFDIPLLQSRFITARFRVNLDNMLHLDLLHAARRLWKRRLGDCSLANIERHVLKVMRTGDVPGSLIPQLYFDYLNSRDARPLVPAFRHNRTDIISMVSLTAAACGLAENAHGPHAHADDRLSLARLYFRQGEMSRTIKHTEQLLQDPQLDASTRCEAFYLAGFAFKRLLMWEDSGRIWLQMTDEFPQEILPRIELAKYFEHRSHELDRAEIVCEETLNLVRTSAELSGEEPDESVVEEFTRRLARIRRKTGQET